jgi:hypothetical protein
MAKTLPVLCCLLSLASLFVLPSCSARIEGALGADGSAELFPEASLEPRTAALIRSLSAFTGHPLTAEAPLIDGPAIALSMSAAPGITGVSLSNLSPRSVAGRIALSRVDAFLSPGEAGPFIRYESSPPGGRLTIRVDRQNAPAILARLSAEVAAYLGALMAPAATGEKLSRQEYLDLVSAVYGPPVAEEIAAARIKAAFEFPRPVTGIRGGEAQGRRALFDLALTDLLVLEKPLDYEVSWE